MYNVNIEARSCNHHYGGRTISTTYCECVFVALVTPHAMCMSHNFICDLSGSIKFLHLIS